MKYTVEGNSLEEIYLSLKDFFEENPAASPQKRVDLNPDSASLLAEETAKAIVETSVAKNLVKERGQKKKLKVEEQAPLKTLERPKTSQVVKEIMEEKDKRDAQITKDDVFQALQDLNIKKGLAKAKEMLTKFNCERISDLETGDFQAFVAECNAGMNA